MSDILVAMSRTACYAKQAGEINTIFQPCLSYVSGNTG